VLTRRTSGRRSHFNHWRHYRRASFHVPAWLALAILLIATHPQPGFAQATVTPPDATGRDLHSIIEDGVLRVAMTRFDLPAFHKTLPDGTVVGLEAELARGLGRALNIKVALNTDYGSFDSVAEAVATGRADIGLSKLSQTYYRVLNVRFSQPYVTLHHALLYDRKAIAADAERREPVDVLRKFRGKIGVIAGSAYVDFGRRNFPEAEVVPMGSWSEVVEALRERRVAAIYRDEFEIQRVLKGNPALIVPFGAAIITDQMAFLSVAICDSCVKLQQFINYHLAEYPTAYPVNRLLDLASKD
jgi:polar amino acid transport system substrate-binding protein